MQNFNTLIHQQKGFLDGFPGDNFFDDITGHREEWRTELTLDYCPSDESEELEDEYSLVFALIETDSGEAQPTLTLVFVVAEVGVDDTHKFQITDSDDVIAQMTKVFDVWGMHKDSLPIAKTLVDKIFALKERDPDIFVP